MNIVVVHPGATKESATALAKALNGKAIDGNKLHCLAGNINVVINYGYGGYYLKAWGLWPKKIINNVEAIQNCVDKRLTFRLLRKAGVKSVGHTCRRDHAIARNWEITVCRSDVSGRANNGLHYHYHGDGHMPRCPLYTEYFEHVAEYRIVVLCGKVVGRYHKQNDNGTWNFVLMLKQGFEDIDKECLKAAKALGIDYVGFDVLENADGDFAILEANSGPILTDESIKAFKQLIKTL